MAIAEAEFRSLASAGPYKRRQRRRLGPTSLSMPILARHPFSILVPSILFTTRTLHRLRAEDFLQQTQ